MVWESYIKYLKEYFIRIQTPWSQLKKPWLCLLFSTHLSVFVYPDETLFLVFDTLIQKNKQDLKTADNKS